MLKLIVPEVAASPLQQGARMPFVPVEDTAGSEAAKGLLRFAEKSGEIVDHEAALKRTVDLATGASDLQSALDKKRLELDADPDHATRSERFQKFAEEQTKARTAGMDDETKALFIQRIAPLASGMELSVRHQARTDAKDEAVVTLRANNDDLVKKAADAKNPLERDALLAQVKDNIDNALAINMLSPAQHKSELQATLVKADQAAALKAIRDNPGQAALALAGGKAFGNLDVVTREKLIDAANSESRSRLSQALAIEARNDRVEAKVTAKYQEQNAKEVDARASDGTLTRDYLEQVRPMLKPDDYKAGLAVLKGGGKVDDKDALGVIMPKLDREDVGKELGVMLDKGQLTTSTYRGLMEKNREALKDDGPPSPYKRGYALVNDTLAPGLMFDSASAKIAAAARASALLEYNAFADANRDRIKANPTLATDFAQDVVKRHQLINFNQIGLAIGLPQGFDGTRETIEQPDLVQAGKRVLQLFDAKQISLDQKNLELRKLDQWDEIIKQRNAANAAPAGPQGKPKVGDGGPR